MGKKRVKVIASLPLSLDSLTEQFDNWRERCQRVETRPT